MAINARARCSRCARDSIRMQICSSRAKNVSSSRAFPSVACTCAMLVSENVGLAHEGRGDASAVGATAAALRLGLLDCRGDASCVAADAPADDRGMAPVARARGNKRTPRPALPRARFGEPCKNQRHLQQIRPRPADRQGLVFLVLLAPGVRAERIFLILDPLSLVQ